MSGFYTYREQLQEIASRLGAEVDLLDHDAFENAHKYLAKVIESIAYESYKDGRRDANGSAS